MRRRPCAAQPERLHGVEFGRVGWQAAGDDFAGQRFEIFADGGGAMDGGAVLEDEQFAGQMALQMNEELDELRALDAASKEPEVEVAPSSPAMAPRFFQLKQCRSSGVSPLGDQVRTRCGFWAGRFRR